MRVEESCVSVPLIESANYGSAGIDSDSVNMSLVHGLTALLTFGAITGDSILKIYSGATQGTKTTALSYKYRLGSGDYKAANADKFGAATSVTGSTGLTLTAATFDHRQVAITIDADQMTDGAEWLTLEIDATATTLNVAAIGIGWPRYPGNAQPTVL